MYEGQLQITADTNGRIIGYRGEIDILDEQVGDAPQGGDTLCQVALTMLRQGEATGHLTVFRSDAPLVLK
jgi:hypothetical protein